MNTYEYLNKINAEESSNTESEHVYYVGWYETDEPFSEESPMFNPLYAIDTPDKFPTVRENFANLLKQILNGNKDYSEYISYPFIVQEAVDGNEAEIKTEADLRRVIEEIERGDWES